MSEKKPITKNDLLKARKERFFYLLDKAELGEFTITTLATRLKIGSSTATEWLKEWKKTRGMDYVKGIINI